MDRSEVMQVDEILKPQLIAKRIIACNLCNGEAVLRLAIDFVMEDTFAFPCPTCGAALKGRLIMQVPSQHPGQQHPYFMINPDNYSVLDKKRQRKEDVTKIVTIQTDLPVHRTRHLLSPQNGGSPSLWLSKEIGPNYGVFQGAIKALRILRREHIPLVKALINYAEAGRLNVLDQEIRRLTLHPMIEFWRSHGLAIIRQLAVTPAADLKSVFEPKVATRLPTGKSTPDILVRFYRTLEVPFFFLVFPVSTLEMIKEFQGYADACYNDKQTLYLPLLREFRSTFGYESFRKKVFDVYPRIFDHLSSVTIGLLYDYLPQRLKESIAEFRVFRDDYAVVKGLYVDIFELVVQSLHFLGPMVNIVARNDPGKFYEIESGSKKIQVNSINRFIKLKAYEKLSILKELPELNEFIGRVSRPMRNDIGHFNAVYDYRTGDLVYEDGTHTNYVLFLNCLLESFRAIWHLLNLLERVDIDIARCGI